MKLADLKNAYPSIPQECHDALTAATGSISETSGGRRSWSFVLAVILCLLLLLAGAAIALEQFGILNFGRLKAVSGNYSMPEVASLVSVNPAERTHKGVKIKIKEAYFDGRVLEVLLSLCTVKQSTNNGTYQQAYEGSNWSLDSAWSSLEVSHGYIHINGQRVNIRSSAFQPGDTSGEYQYMVDSDLEYEVGITGEKKMLRPKGTVEVAIEIMGYPIEDAISFTLPVPDTGKWSLPLPPPAQVNGCTVTFTDLHFSPINAYIEYSVQVPATMVPNEKSDDSGLALFDLQDRFCPMGLTDDKGESLGMGKAGGIRECRKLTNGDLWIVYYNEYTASATYPGSIYLSIGGISVPIPMNSAAK